MNRRGFLECSGFAALGALAASPLARTAQGKREPHDERRKGDAAPSPLRLFLCGDVMTGRGIDQILPHPVHPRLHEPYVRSASGYVQLAEYASGPIETPVDFDYVWGDALAELADAAPHARIVNLETAVTESENHWAGKSIHYRMHPANVACLTAAGLDCCVVANNHVLDWGYAGLAQTLETLRAAGMRTAGAGRDRAEAEAPAALAVPPGRVLIFAFGSLSSGIPHRWGATDTRAGVNLLENHSMREIARRVRSARRPGDIAIASIHWGDNWGYDIPGEQRRLAHRLIDESGVDLVHGHSSHHPKGIEVYRGKAVLYGCGDFLNDYEGIRGHEEFRPDLSLMYFPSIDRATGRLLRLELSPMRIRRLRCNRARREDAQWLSDRLTREGRLLGTRVELSRGGRLLLQWS